MLCSAKVPQPSIAELDAYMCSSSQASSGRVEASGSSDITGQVSAARRAEQLWIIVTGAKRKKKVQEVDMCIIY